MPPRQIKKRVRAPRMKADDRTTMIRDHAATFFAESGFASTRELADGIGIRQALIYKYFDSKDHLINEVYSALEASDDSGRARRLRILGAFHGRSDCAATAAQLGIEGGRMPPSGPKPKTKPRARKATRTS